MAGWSGFSDEELRRMQQKETTSSAARGRKPVTTNRSRQQLQRERALHQAAQQRDGSAQLPPEQLLSRPAMQAPNQTAPKITPENESEKSTTSQSQEPVVVNHHSVPTTEPAVMAKELEKQEVELRDKTRLEQLQQEQRIMEEKNKRKKALLTKTIAEKSKQTQAEAVKLKKIQKELQALDDMVSNDIGILRGRIEQASWEYSAARKRYEKAEAEYVSAKLDLHKKTEVKEQLTEHLYAIIQENEQRKARKLEELMKQLELQADEERFELEIQVEKMLQEVEAEPEVEAETGGGAQTPPPESQPVMSNPPDSGPQCEPVAAEVPASPS
ncbi:RAB6-interacting golgin isoform X1 [Anguilla rostrata]|uniref:RAB6-interacting golgin isoform X1 n=3 Tax=Anguilla rostrata TaxID=7938 RepID=UPI0030D33C51